MSIIEAFKRHRAKFGWVANPRHFYCREFWKTEKKRLFLKHKDARRQQPQRQLQEATVGLLGLWTPDFGPWHPPLWRTFFELVQGLFFGAVT